MKNTTNHIQLFKRLWAIHEKDILALCCLAVFSVAMFTMGHFHGLATGDRVMPDRVTLEMAIVTDASKAIYCAELMPEVALCEEIRVPVWNDCKFN